MICIHKPQEKTSIHLLDKTVKAQAYKEARDWYVGWSWLLGHIGYEAHSTLAQIFHSSPQLDYIKVQAGKNLGLTPEARRQLST